MVGNSDHNKWNYSAIKLLLALYKERKFDLRDPLKKKKNVWREIIDELEKKGFKGLNIDKADRKIRNLKRTYKQIELRRKTGRDYANWLYFDDMDEIFGDEGSSFDGHNTASSFQEESEDDLMFSDATDCLEIISSADEEEEPSSSFLHTINMSETNGNTSIQMQLYYQTNQIIKIEKERNEHLSRIASAMEESNRLFQKYINIIES